MAYLLFKKKQIGKKQMEIYSRGGEFINRSLSEGKADNEQLCRPRS